MSSASTPEFPPKTLSDIYQVLGDLQQKHLDLGLSPKLVRALHLMCEQPKLAATLTITQLAPHTGISPASLTRLAKALGLSGFPGLQALFAQAYTQPKRFYSQNAHHLLQGQTQHLQTQIHAYCDTLQALPRHWVAEDLQTAVFHLCHARRIRIAGRRQSYGLAVSLSYMLGLIRDNVAVVGAAGEGQAQTLTELKGQDLVVVLGMRPYSRDTVVFAQIARQQGIPILALTDTKASPLVPLADTALFAPCDSPLYTNSMLAAYVLMEVLLLHTARRLGEPVVKRLSAREEMINRLNDEF